MRSDTPVRYEVEPPAAPRNRLTALFRAFLALPHLILVGGPALGILGGGYRTGAFGVLAGAIAVVDWFAILVTGQPVAGLQNLKHLYLRWRARALAYCALLRDEYPPFGEGEYPAVLVLPDPPATRDKVAVALRLVFALPHALVLLGLLVAWVVVAIASWLSIVITGHLAPALWRFGRDVIAYGLRLEAYLLLVHDEFPPFVLTEEGLGGVQAAHPVEDPLR